MPQSDFHDSAVSEGKTLQIDVSDGTEYRSDALANDQLFHLAGCAEPT